MASLTVRRAREEDARAIVQLTQENLRGRLVDGGHADGFLSIALTEEEVWEANRSLYPTTPFLGRPLDQWRRFVYGPVCVARDARGSGVLQALFAGLLDEVAGRYDVGAAFADAANPRSLQAHVRKLGMQVLRGFEFEDRSYHLLAFGAPPSRG